MQTKQMLHNLVHLISRDLKLENTCAIWALHIYWVITKDNKVDNEF